jgi:hypothetical protein
MRTCANRMESFCAILRDAAKAHGSLRMTAWHAARRASLDHLVGDQQ